MTARRPLIPLVLLAATAVTLGGCAVMMRGRVGNRSVPEPAKTVDLNRYVGLWYEIGRYENWFERGCEAATAEYRARDSGVVQVINTCRAGSLNGPVIVGPAGNLGAGDASGIGVLTLQNTPLTLSGNATLRISKTNRRIITHDLNTNHRHRFTLRWIHFAWHDRRTRFIFR